MQKNNLERISTGSDTLDSALGGGLIKRSLTVVAGPPGAGKTIFSQQLGFKNASSNNRVLFLQTLSEPTAKTLTFASQFSYFDQGKIGDLVHFVDLGDITKSSGTESAIDLLIESIKERRPSVVVIDSFKAFDDLSHSREALRKFTYEVAVKLLAWECTCLLLGEFNRSELEANPLFSIVDGIIYLSQKEIGGEIQRYLQITKMRGTSHCREPLAFEIDEFGINVFAPRFSIERNPSVDLQSNFDCLKTGIGGLDNFLGLGIPRGSSVLVTGSTGSGKSLFGVEFLYRGLVGFGESALLISYGETKEKILATASVLGWDLQRFIDAGTLEIIAVPLSGLRVELHLQAVQNKIENHRPKRVVFDSISAYLDRLTSKAAVQERTYQLATLVQSVGAVGFFIHDTPHEGPTANQFGVVESILDGIISLKSYNSKRERKRELQILKMRGVLHSEDIHSLKIEPKGFVVA